MENSNPVILEISSDDEASFGDASGGGGGEDHDWLSELLDEVDRGSDDSDDVVLVDEVVVKPKKSRLKSSNSSEMVNCNGCYDDDDDECVILDGDPDKPLAVENGKVDDEDSDDLLVVGEKGQVACRDFPHPRHLCVTFPFASTPHYTHCDRCHCYVCDSLAPCVHWSSSISSIDHCHATDKEEFWRSQRKSMKESEKTQPIPNVVPHASLVPSLPLVQANSLAQNQDVNQDTVRPWTHLGIPNITNQGSSQRSRSAFPRYQPHLVPQQLHSSAHNRSDLSRNRRHIVGSRGPQFSTQCTAFKRSGLARVDLVNDSRGSCLSNNSYRSQFSNNPLLRRCHGSSGEVHMGTSDDYANFAPHEPQMSTQTSVSSLVTIAIPTRPQVSSQQYRRNFQKAVSSQPQIASQPYVRNHFQNTAIPQHPLVSRHNGGNTFHAVPSQTHVSTPLYTSSTCEHPLSPMSSQHSMDRTYGCFISSQPEGYADPTSLLNGQNICQQENQMQSGLDSNFADFGFSWVPPISGSNQQIPAGSFQLQNPVPADNSQFQSVPPEDNSYGHVVPKDNFSLVDDSNSWFPGITEPDSLDFQFDTWMFENQSVPGALEVSVPPGLNVYSPEPGTIDAGTLFDF
ncbi:Hypothetical predicted protein [Olea europaea subsp. europaea]|uniref:Uncharacterized protein n=1 Tax=Olea europaea subsp. europaea TaxID=158383 RepID=A0A8S0V1S2_OLEEU|nr:Hypothetical predicted protein [Olea europaea subsp. europaea]